MLVCVMSLGISRENSMQEKCYSSTQKGDGNSFKNIYMASELHIIF